MDGLAELGGGAPPTTNGQSRRYARGAPPNGGSGQSRNSLPQQNGTNGTRRGRGPGRADQSASVSNHRGPQQQHANTNGNGTTSHRDNQNGDLNGFHGTREQNGDPRSHRANINRGGSASQRGRPVNWDSGRIVGSNQPRHQNHNDSRASASNQQPGHYWDARYADGMRGDMNGNHILHNAPQTAMFDDARNNWPQQVFPPHGGTQQDIYPPPGLMPPEYPDQERQDFPINISDNHANGIPFQRPFIVGDDQAYNTFQPEQAYQTLQPLQGYHIAQPEQIQHTVQPQQALHTVQQNEFDAQGHILHAPLPFRPLVSTTAVAPFEPTGPVQIARRPQQLVNPAPTVEAPLQVSARSTDFTTQLDTLSPLAYIHALTPSNTGNFYVQTVTHARQPVPEMLDNFLGSIYLSALERLLIPKSKLEDNGYLIHEMTVQQLSNKRRCFFCRKFWGKVSKVQESALKNLAKEEKERKEKAKRDVEQSNSDEQRNLESPATLLGDQAANGTNIKDAEERGAKFICTHHPGHLIKQYNHTGKTRLNQQPPYVRIWSCCKQQPPADPCSGRETHQFHDEDLAYLRATWDMHPTPEEQPEEQNSHRIAVAIDCEMGTSTVGDSELIRVTLIDYFTSETLLDRLVKPTVPMQHLNTRYSGVTWDMLNAATARGETIRGKDAAREAVWHFVGPNTIVVAHSGHNDLSSLRWRHGRIVDTFVIEDMKDRLRRRLHKEREEEERKVEDKKGKGKQKNEEMAKDNADKEAEKTEVEEADEEAEKAEVVSQGGNADKKEEKVQVQKPKRVKGSGPFSLKTLTKTRLKRDIQIGEQGHDSLEDALATRDLAHFLVRQIIDGIGKTEAGSQPLAVT